MAAVLPAQLDPLLNFEFQDPSTGKLAGELGDFSFGGQGARFADFKSARLGDVGAYLYRYEEPPRLVLGCYDSKRDQRELQLDEGLALTLSDLELESVGASVVVTAVWRKGLTTYRQRILCSADQIVPFGKQEFPEALNAGLAVTSDGTRLYFTERDPQRDISANVLSQHCNDVCSGPLTVHLPADPLLFRDQLVVGELPTANADRIVYVEGAFPFDGNFGIFATTVSDAGIGPPEDLTSSFTNRAVDPQRAHTASGYEVVTGTYFPPSGGSRVFRLGTKLEFRSRFFPPTQSRQGDPPGEAAPDSRSSRAALGQRSRARSIAELETAALGNVAGASYRSARLAPAGHDSVIVVGLAAEPPSFDTLVKAQLVHGNGSAGAVATIKLPPFIQPARAIPVMGYRNELYVSLDDTLLPDEESGLYRFPLTLEHGPCQAGEHTLCLNGGRFKVELAWRNSQGETGAGHALPLTGDTGTFWIFDPGNLEAVVKVLDAQGINDHFWVFAAGLTDLGIGITVTDTETGQFASFFNTLGKPFAPYQNTQALPGDDLPQVVGWMDRFTAPASDRPAASGAAAPAVRPRGSIHSRSSHGSTAACTANATTLCLAGGRFAVSATFETAQSQNGAAQTVAITADTGYLWFFDQDNVEALIKVLDACVINQRFWVFAGGLTDVKVVLTVRDTVTGQVRTYTNPLGAPFQPIQDTGAFATCS